MFYNCKSINSLDLSNFDTSKVTNMTKMFYSCISLSSLNLSNFNTSSFEDISSIFENCKKLEYVNFYPLISNENMNISNMFLETPDMFIYCLNDDIKNENILAQLESKECKYRDCVHDVETSKEKRFENLRKTIEIFNDKCIFKSLQFMSQEFIISDQIPNISIYFYEIDSNIKELESKYTNLTFIFFTQEVKDNIRTLYGIDEESDIYILIMDLPSNDSKTVTSDYDYKFILENGTELDLNEIQKDIYVNISVPIRDLNSSNFDYAIIFAEQGYDIYDINSEFYNDICTSANISGNDIILKDRVNEIYPSNITLCKDNCEYKGVLIEEKKVICECNLNRNKNYSDENEDNNTEEQDANFISYFLDNINYKIFKCYKLLIFDNLKYNYASYAVLSILFIMLIINIFFSLNGIKYVRALIFRENQINQFRKEDKNTLNPIKKNKNKRKGNTEARDKSKSVLYDSININRKLKFKKSKFNINLINLNINRASQNINIFGKNMNKIIKKKIEKKTKNKSDNNEDISKDINDSPFTKALREDKRNVFQIFFSIIFQKIDLISLFIDDKKIKVIVICQYILSLLIDFFLNALLYSDDVISHKYHNNGKLDFIVTVTITLLSNIITSIICYFNDYSEGIEERLEQILEIKREYFYLNAIKHFFKIFKFKLLLFFANQIIIISCCYYYIVIFCIVYSCSQVSLLTNYFTSILEGILTSIAISLIIVITRKIGLFFKNRYIYNTSKYINEHS